MKLISGQANIIDREKLLYEFLGSLRGQRCHINIEHKDLGKFDIKMLDAAENFEPIPELGTPMAPTNPMVMPTGEQPKEEILPFAEGEMELKDFESEILNHQFPPEEPIPQRKN